MAIDREALAWAAGFFDGEGHTGTGAVGQRKDGSSWRNPIMTVSQTHPEVLERFADAVGVGKIRIARPARGREQQVWVWNVTGLEKVQYVTALLWPWLGSVKREQASAALLRHRQSLVGHRVPRGTSRLLGVYWHHAAQKWAASISIEGHTEHLGLFESEEDAGNAARNARALHPYAPTAHRRRHAATPAPPPASEPSSDSNDGGAVGSAI